MKIFAIRNDELGRDISLGWFFYYEKPIDYYIELNDTLDEWDFPFILDYFARKKQWFLGRKHSFLFLSQRVIPSDRQNIGMVLKNNGMEEYDEVRLFLLADGRCAQDECYLKKISYDQLPERIRQRREQSIVSAAAIGENRFLIGFQNGRVGIFDLNKWKTELYFLNRMKAYKKQMVHAEVTPAGTELCFENYFSIWYSFLYRHSEMLPVTLEQLMDFAVQNMVTTQEMTGQMGCTRQNISDLVRRRKLQPLALHTNPQLFARGEFRKILK